MTTIANRIHQLQSIILETTIASLRQPKEVMLVAVSKGHPAEIINLAYQEGLTHFGESYIQESRVKINALSHLPICWHYLGSIQSNKTKYIAKHFTWVHTVSNIKTAYLLNQSRTKPLPPLNVCIQVNFDNEINKNGVAPHDAKALASKILQLPHLKLRGLMLLPKPEVDESKQYLSFLRLTQFMQTLNSQLAVKMDTLSMGMSQDFKAAICAGSTIIRLGTAIFGAR